MGVNFDDNRLPVPLRPRQLQPLRLSYPFFNFVCKPTLGEGEDNGRIVAFADFCATGTWAMAPGWLPRLTIKAPPPEGDPEGCATLLKISVCSEIRFLIDNSMIFSMYLLSILMYVSASNRKIIKNSNMQMIIRTLLISPFYANF